MSFGEVKGLGRRNGESTRNEMENEVEAGRI